MSNSSQVKSSDALKYLWKAWKLSGVYPTEKYTFLQGIHAAVILIFMDLAWILSLGLDRLSVESFEQFLDNLPMDLTAIGCFLKLAVTLSMHRELKLITELIDELDRHVLVAEHRNRIAKMVKFCHGIFIFLVGCYFLSSTTNAIGAFLRGRRLFHEAWFPFNWEASTLNYACAFGYQYVMINFLGVQVAIFDVCAPIYLIVLKAHLEFLMERTENINKGERRPTYDENYEELVACIKDHRRIMRIFNVLQNTIALASVFQFATTSLVIVTQTVDFLVYHPSTVHTLYKMLFVSAVILEILPCCYYSNQFMVVTDKFVTSIYSCEWFDQTPKFKQTMIIFMQMTQQNKVLVAGKIVPVTLATFVSIMKMTYSLATLVLNFQQ